MDSDGSSGHQHDGGEGPSRPSRGAKAVPTSPHSREDEDVEKHPHIQGRGLISSAALGMTDGLVTNIAFLTGFGGAVSSVDLIRFAGLAAMLAGSVSMFFSGLLSARSESDLFEADQRREKYEIEHEPDEEKTELEEIYKEKGLSDEEANLVVKKVASDKERFLEDVLVNELHIHRSSLENPFKVGAVIGVSFLIGSFVPLAPYYAFSTKTTAILVSLVLSFGFLFAAGAWKGRIAGKGIWRSGLETLLIGGCAAALLYLIGRVIVFV